MNFGVRPKFLCGYRQVTTATTAHDLHGIPPGMGLRQLGLGAGRLVGIFHCSSQQVLPVIGRMTWRHIFLLTPGALPL
jgi:hypothetical protein